MCNIHVKLCWTSCQQTPGPNCFSKNLKWEWARTKRSGSGIRSLNTRLLLQVLLIEHDALRTNRFSSKNVPWCPFLRQMGRPNKEWGQTIAIYIVIQFSRFLSEHVGGDSKQIRDITFIWMAPGPKLDSVVFFDPRGNFHSRTGEPVHSLNEILNVLEF